MIPLNIVILGGGVGGTLLANLLAHKLTRKQARITLIDRTGKHVYQPGWLYVPFGGDPPEKLERAERKLLDHMVDLVISEAKRIDPRDHMIEMADGSSLSYDYLVVATGARIAPEALPGFAEGAHHFYSAEGALHLHAALREFSGGKVVVGVANIPYKYPPAPLEFAFLLDDYLRQRGIRERCEITYTYPVGRVFTIESVAELVMPMLDERNIRHEVFFTSGSVDAQNRKLISLEGRELDYDLLVLVPPHRGADILIESGIGDAQGWVPTDHETLESKTFPDIYVLGDATDLPVSKSGAATHFQARVVAHRLIAEIKGEADDSRYTGQVMCFLETGREQATQLVFDYTHPPMPPKPNAYYHYEKALLNRAYWHLVPTGIV